MIRILVVDDHAVVRQGLRQILEEAIAGAEVDEAASGEEAVAKLGGGGFCLLVLDLSLPGRSGLEVLKELRRERPGLPVLVLSMYAEEQFAVRVLRAGAAGYLNKTAAATELVAAVRRLLAGGRYVSPALAERLVGEVGSAAGLAPHELLSDREHEVFRLLASGRTVTAVAAELGLAVPTVSTHRRRVLEKMGLRTNSDLVEYALVNRILEG